jgi:hypothetical protein
MRNACWISKATNTHSVHVIIIDFPDFPVQHWLKESAEMLCFTYFSSLVIDEVSSWQELKAARHLT